MFWFLLYFIYINSLNLIINQIPIMKIMKMKLFSWKIWTIMKKVFQMLIKQYTTKRNKNLNLDNIKSLEKEFMYALNYETLFSYSN